MKSQPHPKFRLSLLARFEVSGPNGTVDLASKKLAGLLAYLACSAPVPQSREKLATLLWGSHFEAQARQNLRQAIFRLRQLLGQDALIGDGEEVSLASGVIDSDAARLEALIREGSRDSLAKAVDLYRERFLADLAIPEEAWVEWVTGERQRLEDLALGARVKFGEIELAAGRAEKALEMAHRALGINNLREDAHRLIVKALAATGRKAEALKHYQDLVALLKRELNTEPDAVTQSLIAELRSTEPPSTAPAGGEHPLPQTDQPPIGAQPIPNVGRTPGQEADAADLVARGDAASSEVAVRPGGREQRQLTIMVCNLVGSVPLSARLDPEDMHDLFAAFHKRVADVVVQFDGFVAQYLGDSVYVYFGYPAAQEHDAEQAVRAGLALLSAVGTLNTGSDVTLRARVGIATGLVVVSERIAIGETPSLAAQLQAVAAPGEVVIAPSTRRMVGRMFDCRALGGDELKGLLVEASHVRGEAAGVSRFEARQAGTLPSLVGRQEEIDLLMRRWDQAKGGEGRVVLLSGEPGIGKSCIAESLLVRLEGEPHTRLRYFSSPHHAHSPLYPFIAQLERAADFAPGSDAAAKLDKLEALLKPTAANASRDVALIADLLALPTNGRYPALSESSQQKREMTLAALLDQLDGVAANSPVLMVFEDVHWIDPTSLDLLDRTIARIANLPVLLIITLRPEFQPTWVGQPHVTMLPLNRLGRREGAGIIAGVTKGKALPEVVTAQILAHTDGVPLFIEELTSTLLESGLMRETPDSYVLDGPLPPLAIPTTLQASLVARLDRLATVKDLAQIGATLGREFSYELIAAVASLTPRDLDAALEQLTTSGLLSRRGTIPDATYSFKHALLMDAAYNTMLKSRRRQLHAIIAKVLVDRFPAMAESLPEIVAHHFAEAGLASEAIGYWRKAGQVANARSACREAVSSFERALSLLEALPESALTLEQGFDIRFELRGSLFLLGEMSMALNRLRETEVLAERLDDDRRRGRVAAFMTTLHADLRELDEALASGNRALEIAERLEDLRLRIITTTYLEQAHYFRGDYARVVDLATGNLAGLPAGWVGEYTGLAAPASVYDRCWLVAGLAQLGRFAEAAERQAEAVRLAGATQDPYTIGLPDFAASTMHVLQGDWAKAGSLIEQWIAVTRKANSVFLLPFAVTYSAWTLAQLGDESEAARRLGEGEQLLDGYKAKGFTGHLAWFYHCLGHACLLLGRLDEAVRFGDRAIEFSSSQPGFAAHAMHLLGDVATQSDRFDAERGEAHYRKALKLATPLGMRPLVANCHLGLGKLYQSKGTRKQAREHFTTATAMYREMDMPYWREQTEASAAKPA